MRKRSNENLCPRYPGRQWKQMFTFKGNKFDMQSANGIRDRTLVDLN